MPSTPSAATPFVKLPGVLTARGGAHASPSGSSELLRAEHGADTAGRFLALEQMWLHDDLMRAVALSPRIGGIAADLLGEDAVRIYHDNALSKEPGCGRTPWHHDAEHFPLDTTVRPSPRGCRCRRSPAEMGPLSFARGRGLRELLADLEFDKVGTTYDVGGRRSGFGTPASVVEDGPYAVGEVSFHSALCFHTAGPNRTTQPRRALATTYFADGARVVDAPTMISGTWREFLPGIPPGAPARSTLNPVVGRRARRPEAGAVPESEEKP